MIKKITQAFIFAAGRGERMRPLTDTIPKPLIKVQNKAIIDYSIEKLVAIPSIKKIIINGFYLAQQVEDHIKEIGNPKIIFSHEIEKVETGGGLVFAQKEIDLEKPLLLVNGDILWHEQEAISDIDLLCEAWEKFDCDILLGLKKKEEFPGYEGNVHGGGDFDFLAGDLSRFPDSEMSHVFVGVQIIHPRILKRAPDKCFSMSHFYKEAVGEGGTVHGIKGVELKGKYYHIGSVDALVMVEKMLSD